MAGSVSIEVDSHTAVGLETQAALRGMTLVDYLRSLAGEAGGGANGSLSAAEFERALDDLAAAPTGLAVLPAGLGRSDIYGEHD